MNYDQLVVGSLRFHSSAVPGRYYETIFHRDIAVSDIISFTWFCFLVVVRLGKFLKLGWVWRGERFFWTDSTNMIRCGYKHAKPRRRSGEFRNVCALLKRHYRLNRDQRVKPLEAAMCGGGDMRMAGKIYSTTR